MKKRLVVSKVLPVVAMRGTVIMPGTVGQFDVSRKKSYLALERAMETQPEQEVLLLLQKDPGKEEPQRGDLNDVGVIAQVLHVVRIEEDYYRVLVEGRSSASVEEFYEKGAYYRALVTQETESPEDVRERGEGETDRKWSAEEEAYDRSVRDLLARYAPLSGSMSEEVLRSVLDADSLTELIARVTAVMQLTADEKQALLETKETADTARELCTILFREISIQEVRRALQEKIREKVDQNQKEYVLREQMEVIRKELGEEDDADEELKKLRERTEVLPASDEVKDAIREQIRRYAKMPLSSPDSNVLYNYIDTLLSMPWDKASEDNEDLARAKEILERDHYGLKDVKERVMEFLAVRKLTGQGNTPILCLIGPPGTGKTSIGRSIAEALGKKYVRVSLGGVHDEAEIRGHRRTYIGSMPGRIAAAMKQAGVKNPLMVLDEVDKVGSDHRGDVASALLEALDAEQNSKFVDHYIDLPTDLSEVLFIATANSDETIPGPLLDRMEVIRIAGYTDREKAHIAMEHLVPKVRTKNGLTEKQLVFTPEAVDAIIRLYTREAGVRQLERKIAEICRKAARMILEEGRKRIRVTEKQAVALLGTPLYREDKKNEQDEVGVVRGLAWTAVGGTTMPVEVGVLPGKGEILLTGQLGDVMKESARCGVSYIRSVAPKYKISDAFFSEHDLHIHVPEGAVPKDGPSAGITMATAILSAVTNRPVRADLAMTGEITLRGKVLPIGGLKEKLLAAKQAGIGTVIVPEENRPNVKDVDAEITDGLRIVYARTMEEVAGTAFPARDA